MARAALDDAVAGLHNLLAAVVELELCRAAQDDVGAVIALAPAILVFALVDPSLRFSLVLFIGVSLVVTAIRADGGCEVMTLPGMLMGKRTHLVCIVFSPLDWIEDKLTGGISTD